MAGCHGAAEHGCFSVRCAIGAEVLERHGQEMEYWRQSRAGENAASTHQAG
jgi:hypothetical protein